MPWDLRLTTNLPDGSAIVVRSLKSGDERLLRAFREELSARSRELFRPYPWDDEDRLMPALRSAVCASMKQIDASYLMSVGDRPIGHFFLWKAGGNAHSIRHGVSIPELGVAVSDAFQGRGLGAFAVRLLKDIAIDLGHHAIELTTALHNDAGWHTYRKAGFEFQGIIKNPLETDATEVAAGRAEAARFRAERQMVCVLDESRRTKILAYLAEKRT